MSKGDHPCTAAVPAIQQNGQLLECTSCGAFQRVNPETGNITWIRAGRVIAAHQDMLEASARHDENYGIRIESTKSAVQMKDDTNGDSR